MGYLVHIFALYVDSIVDKVKREYFLGCYVKWQCVSILLYADDIIIIAPTVMALQKLLEIVELELELLDMQINSRKSSCMRIGPRFNSDCAVIHTRDGRELQWTTEIRYLGVYLIAGKLFTTLHAHFLPPSDRFIDLLTASLVK